MVCVSILFQLSLSSLSMAKSRDGEGIDLSLVVFSENLLIERIGLVWFDDSLVEKIGHSD